MNEKIKKLRNIGAERYELLSAQDAYQDGFDSAHDLLMKDAEVLVEALSEAIESFPKDLQHQTKAYQALAAWYAKYGKDAKQIVEPIEAGTLYKSCEHFKTCAKGNDGTCGGCNGPKERYEKFKNGEKK